MRKIDDLRGQEDNSGARSIVMPSNPPPTSVPVSSWSPDDAAENVWSKRSTIRDVANAAGVAISSVSRVLSNHPHVSEELRVRVETAARELGYRPNYVA